MFYVSESYLGYFLMIDADNDYYEENSYIAYYLEIDSWAYTATLELYGGTTIGGKTYFYNKEDAENALEAMMPNYIAVRLGEC